MLLQVPGGVELIVILLVMILLFGIPLLLIAVVGVLYFRADSEPDENVDERIAELEDEIDTLKAQIGDGTDEPGSADDPISTDEVGSTDDRDRDDVTD
jgi:sec-independent protein translocase protein TatA